MQIEEYLVDILWLINHSGPTQQCTISAQKYFIARSATTAKLKYSYIKKCLKS